MRFSPQGGPFIRINRTDALSRYLTGPIFVPMNTFLVSLKKDFILASYPDVFYLF